MENKNGKKLLKNTVIYTISGISIKLFGFFLLPLYTSYLTTSDYGTVNLITKLQNVCVYLICCCLSIVVIRLYSLYKSDPLQSKRLFGTLASFSFLFGVGVTAILFLVCYFFTGSLFPGVSFYPTLFMGLFSLTFASLYSLFLENYKAMEKSLVVAVVSVIYFFVQLALNLVFVVHLKMGANGVVLSNLITHFIGTVALFVLLLSTGKMSICLDKKILKESLKMSLPLLPNNLALSITAFLSSAFVDRFLSLASVGLYSLALQFGYLLESAQTSANTAFQPWFFDAMDNKNGQRDEIQKTTNAVIWFSGVLSIGCCLFSKEAILIMCHPSYYSSWIYVPAIVGMYVLNIPYFFIYSVMLFNKTGTKYVFWATLPTSLLDILLSYFFIQWIGVFGAVLSDSIFVVLKTIILFILSRKFDTSAFSVSSILWKMCIILLVCVAGIAPSYLIWNENSFNVYEFLYKILIFSLFFVFFFVFYRKTICKFFVKKAKK